MSLRPSNSPSKASPSSTPKKPKVKKKPHPQGVSQKPKISRPISHEEGKPVELKSTQDPKTKTNSNAELSSLNTPKSTKKEKHKKTSSILLGLPDGGITANDNVDAYVTKIGGTPSWLLPSCVPQPDVAQCGSCGRLMYLLFQAYVPLENSPYERIVYVWACNQRKCMRREGSFRVIRAHRFDAEYLKQQQLKEEQRKIKEEQKNITKNPTIILPQNGSFNDLLFTSTQAPFTLGDLWNNDANVTPFEGTILVENILPSDDKNEITDSVFEKPNAEVSSAENDRILPGDIGGDGEMKGEGLGFGEESAGFAQSSSTQPISWASILQKSPINLSDENDDVTGLSKAYIAETLNTRINTSLNRITQTESDYKMKEWPATTDLLAFPGQYLYITEEVLEESFDSLGIDLSKYQKYIEMQQDDDDLEEDGEGGGTWAGEAYEKQKLPKGVDKAFKQFTERVAQWPEQCVRYEFGGTPLLYSNSDVTSSLLLVSSPSTSLKKYGVFSTIQLPTCPHCGAIRVFEFQLMPNVLSLLPTTDYAIAEDDRERERMTKENGADVVEGKEKERHGIERWNVGMEWGTVLIFVCERDCDGGSGRATLASNEIKPVRYFEELVLIQFEAD